MDEFLADFQFRGPGVRRRVCHDETGPAVLAQGAVKNLYPEVIGVIHLGQAKRESRIVLEPVFIHPVNIERRIGKEKVELAGTVVQIFVIGVPLPNVSGQPVDGKVHLAEADSFRHPLLTVDADLCRWDSSCAPRRTGHSGRTYRLIRRQGRKMRP